MDDRLLVRSSTEQLKASNGILTKSVPVLCSNAVYWNEVEAGDREVADSVDDGNRWIALDLEEQVDDARREREGGTEIAGGKVKVGARTGAKVGANVRVTVRLGAGAGAGVGAVPEQVPESKPAVKIGRSEDLKDLVRGSQPPLKTGRGRSDLKDLNRTSRSTRLA